MVVSGQHHAPASGKGPPVLIVQEAGWAPNPLLPPGIEPRTPCRPARSQTLYRLSYPAPILLKVVLEMEI
jgi:hypothetical protein